MVKRYHGSFPSFSYEFDSRYPLHKTVVTARMTRLLGALSFVFSSTHAELAKCTYIQLTLQIIEFYTQSLDAYCLHRAGGGNGAALLTCSLTARSMGLDPELSSTSTDARLPSGLIKNNTRAHPLPVTGTGAVRLR